MPPPEPMWWTYAVGLTILGMGRRLILSFLLFEQPYVLLRRRQRPRPGERPRPRAADKERPGVEDGRA